MIDGTTGSHVWAERYDCELDDIFALQDEITESIVGRIDMLRKPKRGSIIIDGQPTTYDLETQHTVNPTVESRKPTAGNLCQVLEWPIVVGWILQSNVAITAKHKSV